MVTLWPGADRAGAVGAIAVDAGRHHVCALTSLGAVKCWGINFSGQLGNGTSGGGSYSAMPLDVLGLTEPVTAVSAGGGNTDGHACALGSSGSVFCWGWNFYGQLGDGTLTNRTTAVPVVGLTEPATQVTAGGFHTCAVTVSGAAKCWGDNSMGQLGVGPGGPTRSTAPVQPLGLETGVAAISLDSYHTCALTTAGGVKCWGSNNSGQLGDGTIINRSKPIDVVGLESGVVALGTGGAHSCALTSAGGLKCWGYNGWGQLGDGTALNRSLPVDVVGLASGVTAVSGGYHHTCALTSAGAVKCWGRNNHGQLGDGTFDDSLVPVDAVGLESGAKAVTAGGWHSCALAGQVVCWGYNAYGQAGDGTTADRSVPLAVAGIKPTSTPSATPTSTPVATPTPKDPAGDTDGDTVPNDADTDDDNDGCSDVRELGGDPSAGGQRDPHNFWDFFDVPDANASPGRDAVVNIGDIARVIARFGATGNPAVDPLSPPPGAPAYHPAYDRSPPPRGGKPLALGPPNGVVSIEDIALVVQQFGHSCR